MKSFPHDSVEHDRLYSSEDFRSYFSPFVSNGVFANPTNSCMVYPQSGMVVAVKPGKCFINGCVGTSLGQDTVTLDISTSNYSRYDLITLRLDFTERDIHVNVIKGTPAVTPVYPSMVRNSNIYDIAIAAIKIDPNTYIIGQSNITDLRFNKYYCGIVANLIGALDTTDLFAQYNAVFNSIIESLGESDHITINIEDLLARQIARRNRMVINSNINTI